MCEKKGVHVFCFNDNDNGGEALTLETKLLNNGDGATGWYTNQILRLNSYCNSASIELYGIQITPDILRKLADELESFLIKGKSKYGGNG